MRKGYIYVEMAFSAFIESLNMMTKRARRYRRELGLAAEKAD